MGWIRPSSCSLLTPESVLYIELLTKQKAEPLIYITHGILATFQSGGFPHFTDLKTAA